MIETARKLFGNRLKVIYIYFNFYAINKMFKECHPNILSKLFNNVNDNLFRFFHVNIIMK